MDLPGVPPTEIPHIFPNKKNLEFPMRQMEHEYVYVLIEKLNNEYKVVSVHKHYFSAKKKTQIVVGPIPYYKNKSAEYKPIFSRQFISELDDENE